MESYFTKCSIVNMSEGVSLNPLHKNSSFPGLSALLSITLKNQLVPFTQKTLVPFKHKTEKTGATLIA